MTIDDAIFVLEDGGWWDFLNLPCDDLWHKKFHDSLDMAISALRTQQTAEKNEPLTLEELRGMDCPVWICYKQETWGPQHPLADNMSCSRYQFCFEDYGKTWLAYRRPPTEEGEHQGTH